jgi:colanic acid biosynthesis glycosyl transferase WcaI
MAPTIKMEMARLQVRNVSLTLNVVSRVEAARLMINSDALLLPLSGMENVEKGISSKLYEYQAAGKPILCCSNGTPGNYVRESSSGIVVQPGDSVGLASAVLRLYKDPALASALGLSGREFVSSRYSIQKIGELTNAVFKSIHRRNSIS